MYTPILRVTVKLTQQQNVELPSLRTPRLVFSKPTGQTSQETRLINIKLRILVLTSAARHCSPVLVSER